MIYSLRGTLLTSDTNSAVVECGGVGYKCTVSLKTVGALPKPGQELLLYTHMVVREDAVELFGFISLEELQCFKMLTAVNGVGAKVGIAILSELTPEYIYACIASGDFKALTAASGVGPKLAQRIVLELKDKVGSLGAAVIDSAAPSASSEAGYSNTRKAVAALVSLGFLQVEASRAVAGLDASLSAEELIKLALSKLSQGRL